ncbi:MAG: LysR family transcriptional regulator [Roseomonas sp.]|jgi:DNA-binding transcriptional LysR family regulator|nr:LysR family transcriptional regulator [Roseomonas sp.]
MIEARKLRLVKAIDDHGSLVRAARVLGIAQPALTRALARLEARLRGRLFLNAAGAVRSPLTLAAPSLPKAAPFWTVWKGWTDIWRKRAAPRPMIWK